MNKEVLIKEYDSKAQLVEYNELRTEHEALVRDDKELKTFIKSKSEAYSVRMLVKGAWGFASTSSYKELKQVFKKSYKLAFNASKIKKDKIVMKPFPTHKEVVKNSVKINPLLISDEEKLNFLKEFNNSFNYKKIKHVETLNDFLFQNKQYLNSKGANITQENIYSQLTSRIVGGESLESATFNRRAKKGYELFKNFNYQNKIQELESQLKRLIRAKNVKPGIYDLVVDSEISGTFFHEAVGHALKADNLREKTTCLSMNEEAGNENLTLYDDPTLPDYWGSYAYDDEGMKAKRSKLIDKGVIVNFINDLYSYFEEDLEKTSNARYETPHSIPIPRMSNTVVEPGSYTREELIEEVKNGLLVKGFGGGAVMPITGVFSFKADEAFVIKNGKVQESFKGVNLSGDLKKLLKKIKSIGKEPRNSWTGGYCGKNGQSVPVSEKVPFLTVKGVSVGN